MREKLDNPVWHSLSENHTNLCITCNFSKFYLPDVCPFGATNTEENISSEIDAYAQLLPNFFIVGSKPSLSDKAILKNELVCLQMLIEKKIDTGIKENIIRLNESFDDSLCELINLVQPGYFKKKTASMGDYYGIFQENQLVASCGERMKMEFFSEVSGVVTRPGFTNRGYASQLVAYTVNKILGQNKIAYLHVAEKNAAAIKLYESLGFRIRGKISFWNIVTRDNSIHLLR